MHISKEWLPHILPPGSVCTVCGNKGRHNPGCVVGPKDQTIARLDQALRDMLALCVHPLYSPSDAYKAVESRLRTEIGILDVEKVYVVDAPPRSERQRARDYLTCPYCDGERKRTLTPPWYGTERKDDIVWLHCAGCGKHGSITTKTWELANG